ncbi:piggyBac transposable element-derived protein 3-like [Dermacentor silvarum]|uniref:piggyBac transposable element-derived protein 3-like n=1 Tax=Dermacentor silvarum TaxID=543639 RepID=UPI002100B2E5|nr:piggyBac transposable element-derived protein 3-like [Dermacentor silvarum]
MAAAMNACHIVQTGKSLKTSVEELKIFFECLIIDEQVIPFSGRSQLKQFTPRKPNPEGLKNFVLATPDGLILDFEIYEGKKSTLFQGSSGIAEAAVLRLSNALVSGTKLFFDKYFTSRPLLDKLAEKGIFGTGPVMSSRVPKHVKLSSESTLKAKERGTSEVMVRDDGKQVLVRWYDKKAVTLMSSVHGKQPEDSCRRLYSKEKKRAVVARPNIVQLYNSTMRRVDIACRMISSYRMKARVKKWTIRCFFHLIDMALSNSWLLYTRDMRNQQKRTKDILKFRLSVAEALITKAEEETTKSDSDTDGQPDTKRASLPPLQATAKGVDHLPRLADVPNSSRCKMKGCNMKTKFFCVKCKLFYCITKERRCFEEVHSMSTFHPSPS